ncbi:MAG: ATP-dependent DNA helicase RecG, partial [Firmicutes bacterium]|nr:ATP-dependent DNA helicase RecG [Bacillota bacterium]
SLHIEQSRGQQTEKKAAAMRPVSLDEFTSRLGYTLTGAQLRAISDIANDISKNTPMARIVVGDVGCGKTVVAAAAAYITAKNSYRTVLMVPTEILARQHYSDLSALLSPLGMNVTLIVGSMKAAERREALSQCCGIGMFSADLIIGTHALIEDSVKLDRVGLVITDEQHRFGALQRAALAEKSSDDIHTGVHTLVMSATPIPRTLSLVLYGDLNISVIDEMPKGRQRVDTFVVDETYRERLNAFIRKNVNAGGQVYIVCPAVGDDDDPSYDEEDGLKSAVGYAAALSEVTFPDIPVGFVHGKMKGQDKDKTMKRFADGEIKILVSTTVIEVGVNVPNATLMIVENAERFGLSQLHQLRGRVGRGKRKSYCILVSEYAKKEDSRAYERLKVMRAEYDGFKIAERDLEARGPGDFLPQNGSLRQSGEPVFKLAAADSEDGSRLMRLAADDAKSLSSDEADKIMSSAVKMGGSYENKDSIIS